MRTPFLFKNCRIHPLNIIIVMNIGIVAPIHDAFVTNTTLNSSNFTTESRAEEISSPQIENNSIEVASNNLITVHVYGKVKPKSNVTVVNIYGEINSKNKTKNYKNESGTITDRNTSEFKETSALNSSDSVVDGKKNKYILIVFGVCVLCAIFLNCMNVRSDFDELETFHKGFMGRKLMLKEKLLISRTQMLLEENRNNFKRVKYSNGRDHIYERENGRKNGHINFIVLENHGEAQIYPEHSNSILSEVEDHDDKMIEMIEIVKDDLNTWEDNVNECLAKVSADSPRQNFSAPGFPTCRSYIEDHEPEWRCLDYTLEVGLLPTGFLEFLRQYDYGIYINMSPEDREKRKNLLRQFKLWKKKKQKLYNIIVTTRARKEMEDAEKSKTERRKAYE